LAASGGAILFIDSLDFYGEEERLTVIDLVREAAKVPGVSAAFGGIFGTYSGGSDTKSFIVTGQ
jgi:hypothetical protein